MTLKFLSFSAWRGSFQRISVQRRGLGVGLLVLVIMQPETTWKVLNGQARYPSRSVFLNNEGPAAFKYLKGLPVMYYGTWRQTLQDIWH